MGIIESNFMVYISLLKTDVEYLVNTIVESDDSTA